jgi:hypothetical protein
MKFWPEARCRLAADDLAEYAELSVRGRKKAMDAKGEVDELVVSAETMLMSMLVGWGLTAEGI